MTSNEKESVCYAQPRTLEDRLTIARDFVKRFEYHIPMLVDRITNDADEIYAGWPERLYVIDENGRVAYKGKVGPFGYNPDDLDAWLSARP
jgi:type I thyroxine 5'-deiodinase